MNWILECERRPETGVEVLVVTQSKNGSQNVDKGYWNDTYWVHRGSAQVTHWMPIPELPPVLKSAN